MSKPEDLTGRKFGRLTAIKIVPEKSKGDGAYWECLCDLQMVGLYVWANR